MGSDAAIEAADIVFALVVKFACIRGCGHCQYVFSNFCRCGRYDPCGDECNPLFVYKKTVRECYWFANSNNSKMDVIILGITSIFLAEKFFYILIC